MRRDTATSNNTKTRSHSERIQILMRRLAVVGALLMLVAMGMVHPIIGPLLPIGVAALAAYLIWGITGPLMFTVVLLLRPGELINPALGKLQLGKLTAVACLGFWFFHFFILKKRHLSRDLLSGLMLCFTFAVVICSVKSTDPGLSRAFLFDVWLKLALLFFAIANLAGPKGAFRTYVTTAIWLTVVLGVFGIHKAMTADPSTLIEGSRVGIGKLLEDPNDYAQMLLATGLAYMLNCLLMAPKKRLKILFLVGFLLISSGVYVSKSRGGFLGYAAVVVTTAQSRASLPTLIAGAAVMGVAGFAYLVASRGAQAGGVDASAQGRIDAWWAATYMFIANPGFGVGLQCFTPNYLNYAPNPVMWKPMDTHSAWFKIIGELGTIGSMFFFPLVLLALWRSFTLERWARTQKIAANGDWYLEALLRSIYPSLMGWCVSGTFLSNCYSWFLYIQIAILIAALTLKDNWKDPVPPDNASEPNRLMQQPAVQP